MMVRQVLREKDKVLSALMLQRGDAGRSECKSAGMEEKDKVLSAVMESC